jgi:hypothetical protein
VRKQKGVRGLYFRGTESIILTFTERHFELVRTFTNLEKEKREIDEINLWGALRLWHDFETPTSIASGYFSFANKTHASPYTAGRKNASRNCTFRKSFNASVHSFISRWAMPRLKMLILEKKANCTACENLSAASAVFSRWYKQSPWLVKRAARLDRGIAEALVLLAAEDTLAVASNAAEKYARAPKRSPFLKAASPAAPPPDFEGYLAVPCWMQAAQPAGQQNVRMGREGQWKAEWCLVSGQKGESKMM